jgi:integrase
VHLAARSNTPRDQRIRSRRAQRFWAAAGLDPIGLHWCPHACASVWIAAGMNAKAIRTSMGHADIATTFDLYGHLMPGGEDEALLLIDAYYVRSSEPARIGR